MGFLIGGGSGYQQDSFDATPPRIGDGSTPGSGQGQGIPVIYGKATLGGNVIWHSPVRVDVATEEVQVAKDEYIKIFTYSYSVSLAILVGAGPVNSIREMYVNGHVYFNREYVFRPGTTFYSGTKDQLPDPTIESFEGVGNVPAFRGLSYLVLSDFKLTESRQPLASVMLPAFKFVVDGTMSTLHKYDLERASAGYSLRNFSAPDNQGVYEGLYIPFAAEVDATTALPGDPFIAGPKDPSTGAYLWDNTLSQYSYDEIVADCYAWNTFFDTVDKSVFLVSVLGQSVLGRDIIGVRIFDDGKKPIIGVSNGIHGDEREVGVALAQVYRYLCQEGRTSPDPWLREVCNTHSFFFVLTVNPDGMAANVPSTHGGTGTRENANGVNLNRNWPYFWNHSPDPDKGPSAASEPETQAIISWLSQDDRAERIVSWLDCHGWNSRDVWGLLQEQIFHDPRGQNMQRGTVMYANELLRKRDWSAVDLVKGPPQLEEFRSHHKSYLYTWVRNRARADAWCGLLEYPQIENTYAVNLVFLDVFRGMCMAACDLGQSTAGTFYVGRAAPPPLNNNSFMIDWNEEESRPVFFSVSGLRARHFPGQVSGVERRSFVRLTRPIDSAWPTKFHSAAYVDGGPFSSVTIIGGNGSAAVNTEYEEDGVILQGSSLPAGATNLAGATDGTHIYVSGGLASGGLYLSSVYRIVYPADRTRLLSWQTMMPLPQGLQRHTMHCWNNKLVLVGGRLTTGYTSEVFTLDPVDGSIQTIGNLSGPRGYHTSVLIGDEVHTFGGFDGSNTLMVCEKINLITGVVTPLASLPFSRAEQALAYDDRTNTVYLAFGRTGSTYRNTVFRYFVDTNTMEEWDVDLEAEDEFIDGESIVDPVDSGELIGCAAWIDKQDDVFVVAGGLSTAGTVSDRVWEISLDGTAMYQRQASAQRWGYMRPTTVFNGNPGDQFTVLAAVRNADPINDLTNPYIRLVVYIGPVSSPTRKIKLGYIVPPQAGEYGFYTYHLPFTLNEGESEFRAYLRIYSGGTTVDCGAFQVIQGFSALTPVATTGRAEDSYEVTFRETLNNPSQADIPLTRHYIDAYSPGIDGIPPEAVKWEYTPSGRGIYYYTLDYNFVTSYQGRPIGTNLQLVSGVFSPSWGCQMTHTTKIMEFNMLAGLEFDGLEVWYSAEETAPIPDPTTGFDTFPPNGRMYARLRINGVWEEYTLFQDIQLNHARLNREYRRDVVYWQITTHQTVAEILFSFYGQVFKLSDLKYSFICFGLQATGTGVFMRASRNISLILTDICRRSGLEDSEFDVGGVTGDITGFLAANRSSGASLLDPLRLAYVFDISDGDKLRFRTRNPSPVKTITAASLLTEAGRPPYKVERKQEADLPNKVSVLYIDEDKNYEQGAQYVARVAGVGHGEKSVALPLVMTADRAAQVADKLLFNEWVGRTTVSFRLGYEFLSLEAGDTIKLVDGAKQFTLLLARINDNGRALDIEAVESDGTIIDSNASGNTGVIPPPQIAAYAKSELFLLDLPALRDADDDSGFYYAISRDRAVVGQWNGARVTRSLDEGVTYSNVSILQSPAAYGSVADAIAAPQSFTTWDDDTKITVVMHQGTLQSITKQQVLNTLQNLVALGNEVLAFATATLTAPNTYELTNLWRGLFGTEDSATHGADSTLVVLSTTWTHRYDPGLNDLNKGRLYKAVTLYTDASAVTPIAFVNSGRSLKPYSVAHLKGVRESNDDTSLSWVRRSRIGGGWNDGMEIPLGELTEKYEVDVVDVTTSVVKRTLVVTAPNTVYYANQHLEDFGSIQASVEFIVYQISDKVGRGIAASITA